MQAGSKEERKKLLLEVKKKKEFSKQDVFCMLKYKWNSLHNKMIDLHALSAFIWADLHNLLMGRSSLHTALISHLGRYNFNIT